MDWISFTVLPVSVEFEGRVGVLDIKYDVPMSALVVAVFLKNRDD